MRLLLVEDDAMIAEAIRTGLKRDGFTVDWVHDGDFQCGLWRVDRAVSLRAAGGDLGGGVPERKEPEAMERLMPSKHLSPHARRIHGSDPRFRAPQAL